VRLSDYEVVAVVLDERGDFLPLLAVEGQPDGGLAGAVGEAVHGLGDGFELLVGRLRTQLGNVEAELAERLAGALRFFVHAGHGLAQAQDSGLNDAGILPADLGHLGKAAQALDAGAGGFGHVVERGGAVDGLLGEARHRAGGQADGDTAERGLDRVGRARHALCMIVDHARGVAHVGAQAGDIGAQLDQQLTDLDRHGCVFPGF
jgi:hypothetical protein